MTAGDYATLLRKILRGDLKMRDALGTHPSAPTRRPAPTREFTPSPPGESWHYSIGHWVEDDPDRRRRRLQQPGAFGFYPWIDRTKTTYGVLARNADLRRDRVGPLRPPDPQGLGDGHAAVAGARADRMTSGDDLVVSSAWPTC